MFMKYVIDTNCLLRHPEVIGKYNVVVLSHVLRELEKLKLNKDDGLRQLVARACDYLEDADVEYDLKDYVFDLNDVFDPTYADNMILKACVENGYGIITKDRLLRLKARGLGVSIVDLDEDNDSDYLGYKEIEVNDAELAHIYSHMTDNIYGLQANEYLIIRHNGDVVDKLRWTGEELVKLKYKKVDGKKPINVQQELLFDMLQNPKITVKACFGTWGSGKDFCMLTHAISQIENGKFERLIWVRNNVSVKDVPQTGFLPGNLQEKLADYMAPLADQVGGQDGLKMLMANNKIELQYLGTLRGRDVKNAILYSTEVQNSTDTHLSLLLSRCGEGSQLWVNGDETQSDASVYREHSAIKALKRLKGEHLYGQVTLEQIERSETARLAAKLMQR
jgi:predicted ribonuclease YlaK